MKSCKLTLVILVTLCGAWGHSFENINILAECNNVSALQGSTTDACEHCACFSSNPTFRLLPQANCVITDDVLERIMSNLFDAWRIITGTFSTRPNQVFGGKLESTNQTNGTCNLEANQFRIRSNTILSPQCDDLISEIETMIQDITEQIRLLIAWIEDPENLDPRIVLLEECLKCVNRKLDDTIAKYEQDLGNMREKFGEMQQCLTNSINERKAEILKLELSIVQKNYELVISNVNASNYPSAFNAFTLLNNDTFLDSMVEDIYGTSSRKIENLLTFAYILVRPEQRGRLYAKLLQFMEKNQHHVTMHTLSLNKIVNDDVKRICEGVDPAFCTTLPNSFRNVLMLLKIYTKNMVYSLAQEICNGNHKSILLAGSSESEVNLAGNAFNEVLPDILQRAFGVCSNKLNIISDFVRDLRWNKHKATGFNKLISIVSNPNDQLKVAFKMKYASENLRGPDGQEEEAKDVFITLKYYLPGQVRSLVWQTSCTIKTPSNQYLYISGNLSPDNNRVGTRADQAGSYKWAYEPIEESNGEYYFRIKNLNSGEYMGTHVPWKNADDDWGYVATRNEIDNVYSPRDFYWQIHFGSDSNHVRLFHVGRKGHLMSNGLLELRELITSSINWINTCDS